MSHTFDYDLIPRGAAILCALSGGADSMYLLARLLEGAEQRGYTVRCAHYNHLLRDTAHRDERFVRDWCAGQGVSLTVGRGDVAARAMELGIGLEECARQMRYAFLEEIAVREGCALIATGHHAGDNAETVLMNLIRGCGLNGLTGIPARRGNVIRPMLGISRREIETYLAARAIPHVEDETNCDERYTRNAVRHRLLPLLEELNPGAAEHINRMSAALREDEEELSRQAKELAAKGAEPDSISCADLTRAPRPIALRAIRLGMEGAGLGVSAGHLDRVLALAEGGEPSAALDVPGGQVRREYDRLVFCPPGERESPSPIPLTLGEGRWGGWRVWCTPALCPEKGYVSPREFYLKEDSYTLRSRREGDRLKLGPRPTKTVKKLMIDEKVPAVRRDQVPVIDCGGRVAALGGLGPDENYLARWGQRALHIILTEEKIP